jgi:hypothetical protein
LRSSNFFCSVRAMPSDALCTRGLSNGVVA